MCPDVVVFFEIGTEVAGSVGVVPQVHGHVGEGGRRNQFSWCSMRNWSPWNTLSTFDERVVDFYGSSETRTLGAADVDWSEWIFLNC